MHSSRMRTARGISCPRRGLPQCMLGYTTHPRCGPGDPPGYGLGDPLSVGLETPQVWAWRPLRPLSFPPGCGPGDPPGYLQGMLGYHLQCMLEYQPPLWTEFLTHASQNITLPQTSFVGVNKVIFVSNKYAFQ